MLLQCSDESPLVALLWLQALPRVLAHHLSLPGADGERRGGRVVLPGPGGVRPREWMKGSGGAGTHNMGGKNEMLPGGTPKADDGRSASRRRKANGGGLRQVDKGAAPGSPTTHRQMQEARHGQRLQGSVH